MKKPIIIICISLLAIMSVQAQRQNVWGKVLNQSNKVARTSESGEMIVTQPEGKVYKNLYSYAEGFYSMWGLIFDGKKDGVARDVVVANDGTVYIQNPMTFFPTNSWIKGHKTIGDTIAVELPQLIYVNDNDVNYYATRMNFEVVDGNNQYVKDSLSQTVKYVWRNDSLIKTENNVLIGMTNADGDWNGIGDLVSSSALCTYTNIAPSSTANAKKYIFSFNNGGREIFERMSEVVFEGNYVYVNNIDSDIPDAWVRGDIKGDKIIFNNAQFMGLFSSKHAYKWVMPADVSYNSQDGTTDYKSLPFVSFNYDSQTQSFSCPEHGFMANYGYRLIDLEMQVMMQPTFRLLVENIGKPKNPIFTGIQEMGGDTKRFIFSLDRYNERGSFMNSKNVYYNIYLNDKKYTFTPSVYPWLNAEITDIPIDFSDKTRYDFENHGSAHAIMIYDKATRIGVQAFYQDGDKRLVTDIVYSDGTTVSSINGITDVVTGKTFYTDLSGRRVVKLTKGIYIKSVRMADGTIKSEKIIVQ